MGLIYNGQDLFDTWGISVDSSQTWEKPERDREFIHVPGRSGDLILDRGSWMNVEIEYSCHIDNNFATKFADFVGWLSEVREYQELYDSHHSDVYRMAIPLLDNLSPETLFTDETANFTLVFNCKPQQYLNDGVDHMVTIDFSEGDIEQEIAPPEIVPSWYTGSPSVTLFAPDGAVFTISNGDGTWTFEVSAFDANRIVIDFETGDAILQDEMGEYIGGGNQYLTVTSPGAYSPDFPMSRGFIMVYHEYEGATYTGTLELDPRFWRV